METQADYTVATAPQPYPNRVIKRMEELLTQGVKFDKDKPRWDLLPINITEEVVKVLTYGANKKYSPNNWRMVDDLDNRYYAAAQRHLCSYRQGELYDPETGLSHLAHAICGLMFMGENLLFNEKGKQS